MLLVVGSVVTLVMLACAEMKLDEYIKDKGGRALLPWGSGVKRGSHPAAAFYAQSDAKLGAPLASSGRRGGSMPRGQPLADFLRVPKPQTLQLNPAVNPARAPSGCGEVEELAAGALLSLESAARSALLAGTLTPAAASAAGAGRVPPSGTGVDGAGASGAGAAEPSGSCDTATDSGGAASEGPELGGLPNKTLDREPGRPRPAPAASRLRAQHPEPVTGPGLDLQGSSPKPPPLAEAASVGAPAPAAPAEAPVAVLPRAPSAPPAGAGMGVPSLAPERRPRGGGSLPVVVAGGATMLSQLREAQDLVAAKDQQLAIAQVQLVRIVTFAFVLWSAAKLQHLSVCFCTVD